MIQPILSLKASHHTPSIPFVIIYPSWGSFLGLEAFRSLLGILPCALLNPSYLDFSLHRFWYPSIGDDDGENVRLSEEKVLKPFVELVRRLTSTLAEFNIAMSTSIYRSRFKFDARTPRRCEDSSVAWSAESVWRIVPGQDNGSQLRF